MEQTLRDHLRELAASFHAETGVTPKTVCKRALNDNTYFDRVVIGGQGFTVGTYDRVIIWFSENWPTELVWPAHIQRLPGPGRVSPSSSLPAVASSVC